MSEDDFWFLIGISNFGWSLVVKVRNIQHMTDVSQNERRALFLRLKQQINAGKMLIIAVTFLLSGCTPAVHREPPLQVRQDVGPDAVADDYCWQMLLQVEKPGECRK